MFNLNRNLLSFYDLKCKKIAKASIKQLSTSCGDGKGSLINIGYSIGSKTWLTLFQVCYDKSKGRSLYAVHTIDGDNIKCQ